MPCLMAMPERIWAVVCLAVTATARCSRDFFLDLPGAVELNAGLRGIACEIQRDLAQPKQHHTQVGMRDVVVGLVLSDPCDPVVAMLELARCIFDLTQPVQQVAEPLMKSRDCERTSWRLIRSARGTSSSWSIESRSSRRRRHSASARAGSGLAFDRRMSCSPRWII